MKLKFIKTKKTRNQRFLAYSNRRNRLNNRGLSPIITSLLLIVLVFVAVGIIWAVISNVVNKETEEAASCFNIFGKVTLNSQYTCYNYSSDILQFSIDVGEIEIDELLISMSNNDMSKSFKMDNVAKEVPNVKNYDGSSTVKLPEKNAGATYLFDAHGAGFLSAPSLIKIAPVVKGAQCEISDTLSEIDDCRSLA